MKGQANQLGRRIVALVLMVVGVATLSAGAYDHKLVAEKLSAQQITMPGTPAIKAATASGMLTVEDARALTRFAGQPMTHGLQAKAYAEHYIAAQLRFSAENLDVPDEYASYNRLAILVSQYTEALREELRALPENAKRTETQIAAQVSREIASSNSEFENARRAAALQRLRLDTFFTGNMLQGLLLNVYGWWLLGSIALAVGFFSLLGGAALFAFTLIRRPDRAAAPEPTARAPLLL